MSDTGRRVTTTETSFRIVEAIRDEPGLGISALGREVGLSKGAVSKHVNTLTDLGYLVREGDGYYLSNRFLRLGIRARERFPVEHVRPVVENLAETTGHVANFIAREDDRGVYALRIRPDESEEGDIEEGDVAPLHATAGGKAILAHLPADEKRSLLADSSLPAYTGKTITDRADLERELRSVRDRRVAFDREEYREGHQCVASPIIGSEGTAIGAISVTGSDYHMSGKRLEEDAVGLVTSAAKSVENALLSR